MLRLVLTINYNTLPSDMTIKGILQHITNSSDNSRSIIICCNQFLQLRVNYNMLRLVLTINVQLQHVAISYYN
jgi:hypothetical protein